MTEVERYLAFTKPEIMKLVWGKDQGNRDAVRASFNKKFPPFLGLFRRDPDFIVLGAWWWDFVLANTIHGHWMRDGWLSGIDYGDC